MRHFVIVSPREKTTKTPVLSFLTTPRLSKLGNKVFSTKKIENTRNPPIQTLGLAAGAYMYHFAGYSRCHSNNDFQYLLYLAKECARDVHIQP